MITLVLRRVAIIAMKNNAIKPTLWHQVYVQTQKKRVVNLHILVENKNEVKQWNNLQAFPVKTK